MLLFDLNFTLLLQGALTFLVIFCLETVLSVDNSAVLAVRVNVLPEDQRKKALTYGIFGAYFFRGLSLFFVSYLLANPTVGDFFKIAGGAYLIRLVWGHFTSKADTIEEGNTSWLNKMLIPLGLTPFWVTVIEVEFLDLVFSVDNILACVAMSKNLYIIIAAVFAAILSMRFVTVQMSKLIEKHPYLENRAYIIIGLIAAKLIVSAIFSMLHFESVMAVLENHYTDMLFSILSMAFFLPIGVKKNEFVNPNT